jgi:mannose-6-phosphate isomerase-like protein (cupin superfamily)
MVLSEKNKMEIVNRNKAKPFITKDNSEIREILSPGNSSLRNQSLAEARISPGKATIQHYHIESEEIYYILQGRAEIRVEGDVEEVVEGDGIVILPGQKHRIWNTGDEDLVFLCCCTPSYGDEDTVLFE